MTDTEIERYSRLMQRPNAVFAFGSNKDGVHAGGAAKEAHDRYGALWGVAEGPQGRSYAIPTVGKIGQTLVLDEIRIYVVAFLDYAKMNPDKEFVLTRIGCGIAGYRDEEMAPLFDSAPPNVIFPPAWEPYCWHEEAFPA